MFKHTLLLIDNVNKKYYRLLTNNNDEQTVKKACKNICLDDFEIHDWSRVNYRTLDAIGYSWCYQFADLSKQLAKPKALNDLSNLRKLRELTNNLSSTVFFEPDDEMVKWLIEYAAGRLIIDCGCGTGDLIRKIIKAGYGKIVGIDPFYDNQNTMDFIKSGGAFYNVDYKEAKNSLFINLPSALVLFARPCHGLFVEETIRVVHKSSECLYISVGRNNGVDIMYDQHTLITHKGTSKDNEKVYSINKDKI